MPAAPDRFVTSAQSSIGRPVSARRGWVPTAAPADRRLVAAAAVVILLHLTLLAAVEWTVFQSVLTQALGGSQSGLDASLAATISRTIAIEVVALLFGAFAATAVSRSGGSHRPGTGRLMSVVLMSWSPLVLYSAIILIALATGRGPDVPVFSSLEATHAEVANAIREALPVIIQPITTGRHVANGATVLLMAVLQHRLCGIGVTRSIAAAAAAGIITTLAIVLGWRLS